MDILPQILAQQEEAVVAVLFAAYAVFFAIVVAITIVVCWFISSCLKVIPVQYRAMEPGMVWLLLIPCFNIVWQFFVALRTPESFDAFFRAHHRTEFGDCGRGLGLIACICNLVFPPLALILFIVILIKYGTMKKAALETLASGGAPDDGDDEFAPAEG